MSIEIINDAIFGSKIIEKKDIVTGTLKPIKSLGKVSEANCRKNSAVSNKNFPQDKNRNKNSLKY